MAVDNNIITREQMLMRNIEYQIRNNQFSNKEELNKYLMELKNKGLSRLGSQETKQILDLYDSLNKKDGMPLDMNGYHQSILENQNLIVSQKEERVLKTLEGKDKFTNEFLQVQNEIAANNPDGLTNADTVFKYMADHQKEEITLLPLNDSLSLQNIDIEILNKIRFFITNIQIDKNSFKVDVKTGIFYHTETSEVYEVRKDESTNEYQIFRGHEKTYGSNTEQLPEDNTPQLENEREEEEMSSQSGLHKPKTRKLEPPKKTYMNNAAFTKVSFLIINILTFAILTTMIILLNK